MQDVSLPVPRPSDLFEAEAATSLTLSRFRPAPEAGPSAMASAGKQVPAGGLKTRIKTAVLLSVLLHVALAAVLCVRSGQAIVPVMESPLQATWVTWADTVAPDEKKQLSAPAAKVVSAAAVHHSLPALVREPATETRPVVLPAKDTENVIALDSPQAVVALKTSETMPAASPNVSVSDQRPGSIPAEAHSAAATQASTFITTMAKPRYRDNASPVYPPEARLRGQQGVVIVHVEILPEGRTGVAKVKTSSGYASLDQAAIDAVRGWKFEPARKRGEPVAVRVDIPIRFVLKKNE